MIVNSNDTDLASNAMLAWCGAIGAEWYYIASGKPIQNGYIESFNSLMREQDVVTQHGPRMGRDRGLRRGLQAGEATLVPWLPRYPGGHRHRTG